MAQFVLTAQLQLQAPNNVAQVVNQIQSQLNGVSVNVQVQGTAQANRQVQQLSRNLNTATSAASNLGRTFALSFRRFAAFAVATRAVSLFTNTISKAVEEAIDFERQLVKISQVTGKSLSDLRDLTNEITRLATGFGISSKELINVTQILAQAGLSAQDTKVALDALAKSALAPNFDSMAETAEGAIAVLAQFKQGVGELESQLGSINAVAGAFAVEASDLIDVIRRTGGVFKASGGDLNELIALFTSVRATTRESAESIGTGLRTIFTRIQRPKTIEFLKQFGVELVDLEGKFVGPFEAVRRLSEALSGLGEGDITFIRIAEELGGFRQIGKVLPLLTEFRLAQEALNVAQKGGTGLAQDAATAQQALAIRITKVKEEFLALVRGITETKSFQLFANTALNLASALIKLADALKPIIPLLAAVAAVRIARGFGDFVGGFMGGMRSRRAFNSGGRVMRFARGGFVPGSGNRDTVPAMLQPGEFVIRKSSVKKLGAGNLAAMNENRFKGGGKQGTGLNIQEKLKSEDGIKSTFKINDQQIQAMIRVAGDKDPQDKELDIGAAFLQPEGITRSTEARIDKTGINSMLKSVKAGLGESVTQKSIQELIGKFNTISISITSGSLSKAVAEEYKNGINTSLTNFSNTFASQKFKNNPPFDSGKFSSALNRANIEQVEGNIFEAFINGLSNRPFTDTKINPNDTFDFPFGLGSAGSLFNLEPSLLSDAKRTFSEDSLGSLAKKGTNKLVEGFRSTVANQLIAQNIGGFDSEKANREKAALAEQRVSVRKKFFGGLIQKFASGGVGKNTKANNVVQKGQQAGGIGIFDSDKIPGGTNVKKALLAQIKASKKPYQVISGPAGSGKTTFAAARFGGNFILSPADLVKYSRFVILSGAGKTKTGDFSDDVKSLLSGASSITLLAPDKERLMKQRQSRVESASAGNLQDERSVGALQGTLRAPTDTNEELFRKYPNVNVLTEYAAGGGVGTDTVPALLTPGEFVVNRSSAQKIGYGNLNRMNKVGKYASGGIVQRFSNGSRVESGIWGPDFAYLDDYDYERGQPRNLPIWTKADQEAVVAADKARAAAAQEAARSDRKQAQESERAANSDKKESVASERAASSDNKESVASDSAAINGRDGGGGGQAGMSKALGFTIAAGAIQSLLPPISETSGAFTNLSHTALNMIMALTGAMFALEAFGINLSKNSIANAIDYVFNRKILATHTAAVAADTAATRGSAATKAGSQASEMATKLAGGLQAAATATVLVASAFYLYYSYLQQEAQAAKERAIKFGDVTAAGEAGAEEAGMGVRKTFATVGAVTGSIIGGVAGAVAGALGGLGIGAAPGAAVGATAGGVGGGLAGLGIAEVFGFTEEAEKLGQIQGEYAALLSKADKAVEEGSKRTTDALNKLTQGSITAAQALEEGSIQSQSVVDIINNVKQLNEQELKVAGDRTFFRGSALKRAESKNKERLEDAQKRAEATLSQQQPFINQRMRDVITNNGDFDDFISALPESTFNLLNFTKDGIRNAYKAFINLTQEIERNRKAAEAMNLGLRAPAATAGAMSAEMERLAAQMSGDTIPAISALNLLASAASEAGAVISENSINKAIGDVSSLLNNLGASEGSVNKFTKTAQGFALAQQEFDNVAKEIKNLGKGLSPAQIQEEFAKRLGERLPDGIGKQIEDIIGGVELSSDQIKRIQDEGDLSVFQEVLTEKGKEFLEPLIKIAEQYQQAQKVLIDLTKQQIDAQRNYVSAIQEAQDLIMEGRDIQAKYGGAAVSMEERRSSILTKANARNNLTGLGNLQTGSAAELNARSREIAARFEANQKRINRGEGAGTARGEQLKAQQEDLKSAQKEQIQTIRELIKLEEENLKLIGEKNKLEKDSIDALIGGDIDKFFEMQAAQGAKAAIATGNVGLQQAFGASALGAAAQDIKRQQEAGVQTLFGQQLGGQGGLTERAFGSALGARGVQDIRMAQVAAGTTAEEEASKARLRELGGALGEAGQLGAELAQFEVAQATVNVKEATIKLEEIAKRGIELSERQQAAGMARGGVVYANNGIFVPRGTDTVPAMLTPGEFVVRREAVQRGNNLQILRAMNNGSISSGSMNMSRGGSVNQTQYLAMGGFTQAINNLTGGNFLKTLTDSFNSFVGQMNEVARNLNNTASNINNTSVKHKLDTTNVIHTFTGLSNLRDDIKKEILGEVGRKLGSMKVGDDGKLKDSPGVV